jgi:methyl-accepting chemotaxis protein
MSNASKMDISTVYEMFEEINKKLDKQADSTVEPVQVNMTAIDAVTERLENIIEEVRNPTKVEYQHGIRLTSIPTGFSFHG